MQTSKINEWLQLIASIGVLAGLLLVAYEIRHNSNLAEAESVRAMLEGWNTILISEYETDISALRVKSISDPENLNADEIYKLNAWLSVVATQIELNFEMHNRSLGYHEGEITDDPVFEAKDNFNYYLNNQFGRAWYAENRNWIGPQTKEVWDRAMQESPREPNDTWLQQFRQRIEEEGLGPN